MNDLNKKLILSFLIVFFLGTVALFTLREATESKIQNLNVVSSVPSFELVNFNEKIFTDNNLLDKIKGININKNPRGKVKPSDHTPIEIEIN